jgi:hypothetical protein
MQDQQMFDTGEVKDLSKMRTIELESGKTIHIQNKDPYGFWYVHWEHGQMPQKMQGAYTSFDYALTAVRHYLADKDEKIVHVHTLIS